MILRLIVFEILLAALVSSCSQGDQVSDPALTMQEHAEHLSVDLAVANAINEPNGGDYASAVAITRASNRSETDKKFEVGQLITDSFDRPGSRRPAETLQQGLDMMEQVASMPHQERVDAQQYLRFLFERGLGKPPNGIPIDQPVADCWHKLENGGSGDPAKCVALRRERLPQLSK